MKSIVDPIPVHTVSDDLGVDKVSTSVSPVTGSLPSKAMTTFVLVFLVTYHGTFQDYNDHELIDAMTSLIVLPPPSTPPFFSLFTTSTMPQKFYIVFVGKCTGIFDDWYVPNLFFLIPVIYLFRTGRSSVASHLE
jgi:hypothetical protein